MGSGAVLFDSISPAPRTLLVLNDYNITHMLTMCLALYCTRDTATNKINFLLLQSLHSSGGMQTETNVIQVQSAMKINRRDYSVVKESFLSETWTIWAP